MKVAVTGWYGNDNIGDELLARTTADALRRALPSPSITILTHRPADSSSYPACAPLFLSDHAMLGRVARVVRHVARTRGDWLRLALGLDLLVVGGGSLFHDRQPENIRMWIETLRLYRALGSSVALYGVTIDPVRDPERREEQRRLLALADVITVRDRESARWGQELSGSTPVVLAADPVLDSALLPEQVPTSKPSSPKRIGFNVRPLAGVSAEELARQGARVVMDLLRRFDAKVHFIPMWPGDVALGRAIAASLDCGPRFALLDHDPSRLDAHVAAYRELDVVVAMRLHAVEIAARSGVPVVGLAYDPKVSAFLSDVGLGDYCQYVSRADGSDFRGLDGAAVADAVGRVLEGWGEIGPRVRSNLAVLRRREGNNAASIRDWYSRTRGGTKPWPRVDGAREPDLRRE